MNVEQTRKIMMQYGESQHSDMSVMADDVVFTIMATDEKHEGPNGVQEMLTYFYRTAFDAHVEPLNAIFAEGQAVFEGYFVGKHIGEFAGIPATGKSVRIPMCVIYELEDEHIKRGRVYFEMPVLFAQLGIAQPGVAQLENAPGGI